MCKAKQVFGISYGHQRTVALYSHTTKLSLSSIIRFSEHDRAKKKLSGKAD